MGSFFFDPDDIAGVIVREMWNFIKEQDCHGLEGTKGIGASGPKRL